MQSKRPSDAVSPRFRSQSESDGNPIHTRSASGNAKKKKAALYRTANFILRTVFVQFVYVQNLQILRPFHTNHNDALDHILIQRSERCPDGPFTRPMRQDDQLYEPG